MSTGWAIVAMLATSECETATCTDYECNIMSKCHGEELEGEDMCGDWC